jgi:diguanylate cyclase (GGDEF)-like protein
MSKQLLSTAMSQGIERQELENLRLLDGVDIDRVLPLLRDCPVIELQRGDALITAGQINHHIYIILSGRLLVQLHDNSEYPVAILDAGESVAEISIIDRQPTSAHVFADLPTRVLRISEDALWNICELCHGFAYNLLRVLAQRLRSGNTVIHKIHELLREYEYDATIDPLTGLYNRRWLDGMMWRIMQRCAGNDQPLTVLMIDVDNFKRFNDSHGHLAGDHALHTVARTLLEYLRPEDLVTRYGGEELLVLSPGSSIADAMQIASRLRKAVAEKPIRLGRGESLPPVTISIGIAPMTATDTQETLINKTDQALYRAKEKGKDCYSV